MERTTLMRATLVASIATVSLLAATCVNAATDTWSGLGGNNLWNTAANWDNSAGGNAPPLANDILQFAGTNKQVHGIHNTSYYYYH